MALAKFREDIVSRFHQATVLRAKEHDALLTPEAEPKGAPTKLKGFAAPQQGQSGRIKLRRAGRNCGGPPQRPAGWPDAEFRPSDAGTSFKRPS